MIPYCRKYSCILLPSLNLIDLFNNLSLNSILIWHGNGIYIDYLLGYCQPNVTLGVVGDDIFTPDSKVVAF